MKDTSSKVNQISEAIIKITSNELTKVLDILELESENLNFLLRNLSNKEKDKVMNNTINKLLSKLKKIITIKKYKEMISQIDEITNYYTSKKNDFSNIIEKGNIIASNILYKTLNDNKNSNLLIDIYPLKKYCLSLDIKKEQLYDVLIWIIIRLVAIERCVVWQDYLIDFNSNKEI